MKKQQGSRGRYREERLWVIWNMIYWSLSLVVILFILNILKILCLFIYFLFRILRTVKANRWIFDLIEKEYKEGGLITEVKTKNQLIFLLNWVKDVPFRFRPYPLLWKLIYELSAVNLYDNIIINPPLSHILDLNPHVFDGRFRSREFWFHLSNLILPLSLRFFLLAERKLEFRLEIEHL